jgi:hypothetical protein
MDHEDQMPGEVLATVTASQPRRWLGIAMLALIAFLVLYVAFARPPDLQWQIYLLVVGLASLWTASRLHSATTGRIVLTETELRDETGAVIVRLADIASVDRGAFAFKPSNGFLLRTKTPGPRTWRTGLWWRVGRRIGVGGVASAPQTKFMSEMISAIIAQRG